MMVIVLVAGTGVATAGFAGHLPLSLGWPFALGAVLGMVAGRIAAGSLSGPRLQIGFGVLTCCAALAVAVRSLWA